MQGFWLPPKLAGELDFGLGYRYRLFDNQKMEIKERERKRNIAVSITRINYQHAGCE